MRSILLFILISQIYQPLPPTGADYAWYYRNGAATLPAVLLPPAQIPAGWRKTIDSAWVSTHNEIEATPQQFLIAIPITQDDVADGELIVTILASHPFAVALNGQELVFVSLGSPRDVFSFTTEVGWNPGMNLLQITLYPPPAGELVGVNFLRGTARYGHDRTLRDYRQHNYRINPRQEIY